MTTLLESRYRTVLRVLPSYYRQSREEEMVQTYLDGISEDEQEVLRPAAGEVLSVAALAVRTRLGSAGAPAGYQALGAVVRHFAVLAVALQAASAVAERALTLAWVRRPGADPAGVHGVFGARQLALWWLLPLLWVAAYAALLAGRRAWARWSAAAAATPWAVYLVQDLHRGSGWTAHTAATAALAWLTVLAVCCGFQEYGIERARLPLGAPPGLALTAASVFMAGSVVVWRQGADADAAGGWAVVAGAALWSLARRRGRARDGEFAAVGMAWAVLGLLLLTVGVALLYTLSGIAMPDAYLWAVRGQTAALALAVALAAVAGGHALAAGLRQRRSQAPEAGDPSRPL